MSITNINLIYLNKIKNQGILLVNLQQTTKNTIMTNKEIKFELAKVALTTCRHMTSEALSESLKNLYEWITEETDIATKECTQDEHNNIHISVILTHVRNNTSTRSGITEQLSKVFYANNIITTGDLLKIGRECFKRYRNVGQKSLLAVDNALLELGIKSC